MFIEAITVCVNYADLLDITIEENKKHFDRWLVITSEDDEETQSLCEFHKVECFKTNVFYDDGSSFNKSKALNLGLSRLERSGWLVHLDADTLLPQHTRKVIDACVLSKDAVYGLPRWLIPAPELIQLRQAYQPRPGSADLISGYFNLFHGSSVFKYDESYRTAGSQDIEFQKNFKEWLLLPLKAFHFGESNWSGRKTRKFPKLDEAARLQIQRMLYEINKNTDLVISRVDPTLALLDHARNQTKH